MASSSHPTISHNDSIASITCPNDESTIGLARRLRRMKRRLLLQAVAADSEDTTSADKSETTTSSQADTATIEKVTPALVFRYQPEDASSEDIMENENDEEEGSMAEDEDEASLRDEDDSSSIGKPSPTSVDRVVRCHFPTVTKNKDLMPSFDPESSMLSLPSLADTVSMGSSFSSSLGGDGSQSWANMSSSSALQFRTSLDDIDEYRKFDQEEAPTTRTTLLPRHF